MSGWGAPSRNTMDPSAWWSVPGPGLCSIDTRKVMTPDSGGSLSVAPSNVSPYAAQMRAASFATAASKRGVAPPSNASATRRRAVVGGGAMVSTRNATDNMRAASVTVGDWTSDRSERESNADPDLPRCRELLPRDNAGYAGAPKVRIGHVELQVREPVVIEHGLSVEHVEHVSQDGHGS